jgi:hypothetical protein
MFLSCVLAATCYNIPMTEKHITITRLTIKDTGFFDRYDETKKACLLRAETHYPVKKQVVIKGEHYYVVEVEKNGWGEIVNCRALVHTSQVSNVN